MLHTESRGHGSQAVILLHGFLGSGRNLSSLARRLAEARPDLTCYLPDLKGHGESPELSNAPDLAELARALVEFCERLGLATPIAVGHSLGGRVALKALELEPALWKKLCLLDITPSAIAGRVSSLEAVVETLLEAPASAVNRQVFRDHFENAQVSKGLADWVLMNLEREGEGFRWRIDRAALAALQANSRSEDLWHLLSGPTPMRAIRGSRSGFVSDAEAHRFEEEGCPVTTLDSGHFLHVDAPDALLALLVDEL